MRNFRLSIFVILSLVTSASPLLASDYTVDLGIDSQEGRDAATLVCEYNRICRANFDSLRLQISVEVFRGGRAYIHLLSDRVACCYFSGAASSLVLDPKVSFSRNLFYEGHKGRGDLFIQNKKKGVLYVRFL